MKRCLFCKQSASMVIVAAAAILLCSLSQTVSAKDATSQTVGGEDTDVKGDEVLSSRKLYGVSLNNYHRDQNGFCFLWNDIVLIEPEMEALIKLGPEEQHERMRKRMNLIIRRQATGRMVDTSQVTLEILGRSRAYSSVGSYMLHMVYEADSQTMEMTARMEVVDAAVTITPKPPIESVQPSDVPPMPEPYPKPPSDPPEDQAQVTQPQEDSQPSEEEEPLIVYEYEEEPRPSEEAEITPSVQESPLVEGEEEEEILESEYHYVEDKGEKEEMDSGDKKKRAEKNERKNIFEYAYVATFGIGGILAVIFGISIFWDISVIFWSRRKHKERRAMRRCQR